MGNIDQITRAAHLKLLKAFAKATKTFALAGGTALELYYLNHRFSRDLDFFSPTYSPKEVEEIIQKFSQTIGTKAKLEDELTTSHQAKVRFYTIKLKGAAAPLKIDFIEDIFNPKPTIIKFKGVPVYSAKNIYLQKIITITGAFLIKDEIGKEIPAGRKEVRDIIDIFYLSKKIAPLSKFLKTLDRHYQRGMVQWYRSYSRQDVKLGLLDLALYDKEFDISAMIKYLDQEINKFMREEIK
ncbi:MAG: nucleotidyl transferase AbiEii/AbiGii toxin family protein [bacterium]